MTSIKANQNSILDDTGSSNGSKEDGPEEEKGGDEINDDELKELYSSFDSDGDGQLGHQEIGELLGQLGVDGDKDTVANFIKEVDMDGDGSVSFEEFRSAFRNGVGVHINAEAHADNEITDEELHQLYSSFDHDNNGQLEHDEIKELLGQLGVAGNEIAVAKFIQEVDTDGDGSVSFDEFRSAFRRGVGLNLDEITEGTEADAGTDSEPPTPTSPQSETMVAEETGEEEKKAEPDQMDREADIETEQA